MPFITVGTSSQLQIEAPTRSTTGWSSRILTNTWQKIAAHDHSGSGNGVQLTGSAFADDGINGAKIRLDNDEYLRGRNAANSGDINIVKVGTDDLLAFGASIGDANFTVADNGDATKTLTVQLSGSATGIATVLATSSTTSTRTITLPDATDTLVGRATTDTLTNKSIDSDNNTITNIVNADIKAAAAIALNKLAATTASRALVSDGSGFVSASSVTATELGHVSGVTSAIQTQIDGKLPTTLTTTGDIIYSSSGSTAARLAAGSNGEVLTLAGGVPSWAAVSVTPTATTSKTTTYTATTSDKTILADTSGGAWTLTLPAASGNDGFELFIKKTTSDFNALTVDGDGTETIDGSTTRKIYVQNEYMHIVCDGSNWQILNRTPAGDLLSLARASGLSTSTIANNTEVYLKFASEDRDDDGRITLGTDHSSTSGNGTYYDCPIPGDYEVTSQAWSTDADWDANEVMNFRVMKNTTEIGRHVIRAQGTIANPEYVYDISSLILDAAAGDILQIRFKQETGSTYSFRSESVGSYFEVKFLARVSGE